MSLSKLELLANLKKEALNLEHDLEIADGKKLTLLLRQHTKIIARAYEIENPNLIYLERYDD